MVQGGVSNVGEGGDGANTRKPLDGGASRTDRIARSILFSRSVPMELGSCVSSVLNY